ncbi:glycine zipper 2TM domain-containing protein [Chitinimonas lacunae]|uniref:Glycine zipper 2TM domain-containing protein n=1 Tax=Chitinimonas lacunae TaxID=1963018 RepID=A0ABV8MNP7_9NEIS
MKTALSLTLLAATLTQAAYAESFTDYARVRSSTPEYERVSVPRKECTVETVNETVRRGGDREIGGAIVGGIAGAIIGNQVGKGHGREAATAAGAVIGALAGDRIDNSDRVETYSTEPREVRRCRTVDASESRLIGYRVIYEYRGQQYSAFMPNDPGRELRLRVNITPE